MGRGEARSETEADLTRKGTRLVGRMREERGARWELAMLGAGILVTTHGIARRSQTGIRIEEHPLQKNYLPLEYPRGHVRLADALAVRSGKAY